MKKVFLDTNIWIDYFQGRTPFTDDAEQILLQEDLCFFVSSLSLSTIHYILRRSLGNAESIKKISLIMDIAEILPTSKADVKDALNSSFSDFEDALQNYTALNNDVDVIITRNPKDFRSSSLDVFEPKEFIDKFIK